MSSNERKVECNESKSINEMFVELKESIREIKEGLGKSATKTQVNSIKREAKSASVEQSRNIVSIINMVEELRGEVKELRRKSDRTVRRMDDRESFERFSRYTAVGTSSSFKGEGFLENDLIDTPPYR
jgi:predicted phage-related endonuclease